MLNDSLKQHRGSFLSLYSTCIPSFFTFDDKGMECVLQRNFFQIRFYSSHLNGKRTFLCMFVDDIGVLHPYNNEKIMQIHDNRLIAECTSYDFKEMLERKKVKSWLKSVSAFANTEGGSLFYGVNDEGEIVEQ